MKYVFAVALCCASAQLALSAAPEKAEKKTTKLDRKKTFNFDYSQTPVIDIINQIAAQKEINVIFPITDDLSKIKITYKNPTKMTVEDAWQKLTEILEFASLTFKKVDNDTVTVVKIDKRETTARQTWPLYIDVPINELPDTEDIIRAIFYMHNISVKDQKATLQTILLGSGANATGMLSLNADVQFDEKANGIIITDKANYIQSAMQLIKELDLGGLRDAIEVVPLYYTSANFIVSIIKELLPQAPAGTPEKPTTQTPYFPKNTRVAALDRSNAVVIMGSTHGIDVTKDFIIKYLDLPAETGESIVHVYELQYLSAQEFAPILDQLVQQQSPGAQATGEKKAGGPQRYFKEVIIAAETIEKPGVLKAKDPESAYDFGSYTRYNEYHPQRGGNRLVIAARKQDWLRIEKLIKDLDKPQPQVGIEVLIVDVSVDKAKILGSHLRNKEGFNNSIGKQVNFQTAELNNVVLQQDPGSSPPECDGSTGAPCTTDAQPADALAANLVLVATNLAANTSQAGQMLISIGDPKSPRGLFNVWQILDKITPTTILSQPYLVTTNNKSATVIVGTDKLVPDAASVQGVSTVIKNKNIKAFISVSVQPRISLTNNVNMLIGVKVDNFLPGSTTRQTRDFTTSANVGNGEVLVLGGLTQHTGQLTGNETPLLGRIPLIGWIFKRQAKDNLKTSLLVFIRPVVIEPRKDGVTNEFTKHKFDIARSNMQDHLNMHDSRDPISRWFFRPERTVTPGAIDDYIDETQHKNLDEHISHGFQELENKGALRTLVQNEENPLVRAQKRT